MVLVSSNPATFWLFLIWMAGAGILYIGGAIWMYVRRDVQPIKARDNGLSLLTNIAFLLGTFLRCTMAMFPAVSCLFEVWQIPVAIGFISSIFLLRSWRMFFKFELAHERSQLRGKQTTVADKRRSSISTQSMGGQKTMDGKETWYSNHRFFISDAFTAMYTIFNTVLFFGPAVYLSLSGKYTDIPQNVCTLPTWYNALIPVVGVAYLLGLFVFALKLRKTFDAFGIKNELKTIFWLLVLDWTLAFAFTIVPSSYGIIVSDIKAFLPLVFALLLFIQTTMIPIVKSYGERLDASSDNHQTGDITSLAGILKSPEGFAAFQKYLIGCFCVESAQFWSEIESYREMVWSHLYGASQETPVSLNLAELPAILAAVNDINANYIKEGSRLQVNISAGQRQRVEQAVANLNSKYKAQTAPKQNGDPASTPGTNAGSETAGKHRNSMYPLVENLHRSSLVVDATVADDGQNQPKQHRKSTSAVDDGVHPLLKEKYKDLVNVFNIAQLEVVELMRTDPYPRFKLTKEYQDFVNRANLKKLQEQELRDLNVI